MGDKNSIGQWLMVSESFSCGPVRICCFYKSVGASGWTSHTVYTAPHSCRVDCIGAIDSNLPSLRTFNNNKTFYVAIAAMSLGSEPESGSFAVAPRQDDVDQALEQAEQLLGISMTPTIQPR